MDRILLIAMMITVILSGCAVNCPADTGTCGTQNTSSFPEPTGNSAAADLSEYDPYRFLTEINYSGELEPSAQPVPPGTLPDVSQIPKADQTLVGQTVNFVLSNRFDCVFTFSYDSKQNTECMTLYLSANKIPMILRLETNLGGGEALKNALLHETILEGEVLSVTNISPEEGNIRPITASESVRNMGEDIFISDPPDLNSLYSVTYLYIGRTGGDIPAEVSQLPGSFLSGGPMPHLKEEWLDAYETFERITQRFGLN